MKIDHYTKTVLTIIALCLIWICIRDFAVPVSAQQRASQRVIIAGVENKEALPVSIEKIYVTDPSSINKWEKTEALPITITKVALDGPYAVIKGQEKTIPITIKGVDLESSVIGKIGAIPISVKEIDIQPPPLIALPGWQNDPKRTLPIIIRGVDFGEYSTYRNSLPIHGQVSVDNIKR